MNKLGGINKLMGFLVFLILAFLAGCASDTGVNYHDPEMDFGSIKTIAVMPFSNLTNDKLAGERMRDAFINSLLSTTSSKNLKFKCHHRNLADLS